MALKLYNTLTRTKEEFLPLVPSKVRIYQCGPTVYWTQHLGNLRAAIMTDLIARSLSYLGYEVTLVRNYTDVGHLTSDEDAGEDKLDKAAKREESTPQAIAEKYTREFEEDVQDLNVLEPNFKPKATEHIAEMIKMIQDLIEKGYAYSTDLAIYYDVSKFPDYTKLSGQDLEDKKTSAGKGEVEDPQKKNPADFALWFFKAGVHQNALQTWPSPFSSPLVENGEGFPGWHIECSAMSQKYLGNTLDIHLGGIEHVPVHHTNEIAQSEAATGEKFVNYWLHYEHLLAGGEKMSKSQGTGWSLSEVKEKGFDPLAVRYFFLQAHYKSRQNFTWEALEAAQAGLNNLRNKILELTENDGMVDESYKLRFKEALEDDFNIPKALALVSEVLKSELSPEVKRATVFDFDQVLGLKLAQLKSEEIPSEIITLAEKRKEAREDKNWSISDQLRTEIEEKGYEIKDLSENNYSLKKRV